MYNMELYMQRQRRENAILQSEGREQAGGH